MRDITDKIRLDWLDKYAPLVQRDPLEGYEWVLYTGQGAYRADRIRQAIDRAIKDSKPSRGPE